MVDGRDSSDSKAHAVVSKPMNKITKFDSDSDGSSSDKEGKRDDKTQDLVVKKQRTDSDPPECVAANKMIDKPIDELIQDGFKEIQDINKVPTL